jgi:hypothetical protein
MKLCYDEFSPEVTPHLLTVGGVQVARRNLGAADLDEIVLSCGLPLSGLTGAAHALLASVRHGQASTASRVTHVFARPGIDLRAHKIETMLLGPSNAHHLIMFIPWPQSI